VAVAGGDWVDVDVAQDDIQGADLSSTNGGLQTRSAKGMKDSRADRLKPVQRRTEVRRAQRAPPLKRALRRDNAS
jgi:hypothetical protein